MPTIKFLIITFETLDAAYIIKSQLQYRRDYICGSYI